MSAEPRKNDGPILPMEDPDWQPKNASTVPPPGVHWSGNMPPTPTPTDRWKAACAVATGAAVLLGVSLVVVALRSPAAPPAAVAVEPPPPAFGQPFEEKLTVSSDGKTGYLLTPEGRLFYLSEGKATEIQQPTSAARAASAPRQP